MKYIYFRNESKPINKSTFDVSLIDKISPVTSTEKVYWFRQISFYQGGRG